MKLLIITQVVDKNHAILGFFHRWIEEFSDHYEKVSVICLEEGVHDLPDNVEVYSLGKDARKSKIGYLLNFYKYIWSLRKGYDDVFVHMNQIYVLLGSFLWRLLGKRVGLWYAHGAVSMSLKVAVHFVDKVFTSTDQGLTVVTNKKTIVGQGIDLEVFYPREGSENHVLNLVTVGRVSESKNIDTLLRSCEILLNQGVNFTFKVVGPEDARYLEKMKELVNELNINNHVEWVGSVSQENLPDILNTADVFIHDGSTNSLDKALLEAVLCNCVVISSNPAYKALYPNRESKLLFEPKDYQALSELIIGVGTLSQSKRKIIMQPVLDYISSNYSINNLISGIISHYKKLNR